MDLVRAEQRVKTFTNSVNELKKSWKNGDLDDSVDVVEVTFCVITLCRFLHGFGSQRRIVMFNI